MNDFILRTGAVLAAVALVAAPTVAKWAAAAWQACRVATPNPTPAGVGIAEMRIVLDLAAKLKSDGRTEAVKLCQQLIDAMLQPKG